MADTLLVGNGTLVTFGLEPRLIAGGALLVRGGVIAEIGETASLRAAHPDAPYIDARGQYIMPGMICAHTHTYGAFARGMALKAAPPEDFLQILQRLWWQLDRALQPDDVYVSALVCLVDAIRHGTTMLFDHHSSPNACDGSLDLIARAFGEAGVRGCLCYETSDRNGSKIARAGLRENERFIRSVCERHSAELAIPMLSAMMGLHAAFTLSDETITAAAGIASDLGVGCHIHVAEGLADEQDSLRYHHARTVTRLHRLRVLTPRAIAAHCVHIDDDELAILARSGALMAHNPRSNMNNAVGTARVTDMLRQAVVVGLGNDGFSNDMFQEMKSAYLVHKAARNDPRAMSADLVQQMAITSNAQFAGVAFGSPGSPACCGELSVGAAGDVIIVDYQSPTPMTAANLPWHLIFGVDGGLVTTTIVNGRVLMRDRVLQTLDEAAIAARARELAAALWQRM
jgi:putative selenium metabolism protein SsnA